MLIRLVRMTFRPSALDLFLALFDEAAPQIRAYPGCRHLELWHDEQYPNLLTTCSHWDTPDALDQYRRSDLFRTTWKRTRAWFAAPPQAYSHVLLRAHPSTPEPV